MTRISASLQLGRYRGFLAQEEAGSESKAEPIEAAGDGRPGRAAARPRSPCVPIPEDALILIPLRNAVLFPGVISPITIGRASSVAAANEAARSNAQGRLPPAARPADRTASAPKDLYRVGTAGKMVRYAAQAGGAHHLMVQGEQRFRVLEFLEGWPFLVARVAWMPEADRRPSPEIEARFLQLKAQAAEAIHLLPNAPDELAEVVQAIESPGQLADMVANLLDIKNEEKQDMLETFELERAPGQGARASSPSASRCCACRRRSATRRSKEFDERQREHVLREQMRQIQKELGDGEDTRGGDRGPEEGHRRGGHARGRRSSR